MPVNISYTNARNEVIVLDNTEWEQKLLWSIYGREGFEAPSLSYKEVKYANGDTDILSVEMEPREVTLYFVVRSGTPHLRMRLEELKKQLIQTGPKNQKWGDLMVRRVDGRELHLNCVYTQGLDEFIRKYPHINKFSLTFRAEDPFFYDGFEQSYMIQQDDRAGYLFMDPELFMDPSLFMMSASGSNGSDLYINGDLVYPTITINGPAENISLTNKTTGRKIELATDVVLDTNEQITITTRKRQRTIRKRDKYGVVTNLVPKLTSASSLNWWLTRGSNIIDFNNSATTPETYLKFVYKEGYLSAE